MTGLDFFYSFIPIFVAMDIGGLIPVYLTLTKDLTAEQKQKVGLQALITAFLISIAFIVAGKFVFRILGITTGDFQIAGGVLLLVLAVVEMIRGEHQGLVAGANVGPVPLGTPLIVGPAVLTSLLLLISLRGYSVTMSALVANLFLVWLSFRYSHKLVKLIGPNGLRATSQVVSLLLAAIAVSMIRRGLALPR